MSKRRNWHRTVITGVLLAALTFSTSIPVDAAENSTDSSDTSTQGQQSTIVESNGPQTDSDMAAGYKEMLAATGGLVGDFAEFNDLPMEEQNLITSWVYAVGWEDTPVNLQERLALIERLRQRAKPRIELVDKNTNAVKNAKADAAEVMKNAGFSDDAIAEVSAWIDFQLKTPSSSSYYDERDASHAEDWTDRMRSYYWPQYANSVLPKYGISQKNTDPVIDSIGDILYSRIKEIREIRISQTSAQEQLQEIESVRAFDSELHKDFRILFHP